jgi:hypothetical protein
MAAVQRDRWNSGWQQAQPAERKGEIVDAMRSHSHVCQQAAHLSDLVTALTRRDRACNRTLTASHSARSRVLRILLLSSHGDIHRRLVTSEP